MILQGAYDKIPCERCLTMTEWKREPHAVFAVVSPVADLLATRLARAARLVGLARQRTADLGHHGAVRPGCLAGIPLVGVSVGPRAGCLCIGAGPVRRLSPLAFLHLADRLFFACVLRR